MLSHFLRALAAALALTFLLSVAPAAHQKALRRPAAAVRKKAIAKKAPARRQLARRPAVPRRFLRSFSVIATAYVPIDTPMEGGRWTCTMRDGWATKGIAVDPRLIRLGSLLYVPGYGRALADDTGGRIKGRHIDVRLHSIRKMHRWGVKRTRVYVLKDPPRKSRKKRAARRRVGASLRYHRGRVCRNLLVSARPAPR